MKFYCTVYGLLLICIAYAQKKNVIKLPYPVAVGKTYNKNHLQVGKLLTPEENTENLQAYSNYNNNILLPEGEFIIDSLVLKSGRKYIGIKGKTVIRQGNSGYGLFTYVAPDTVKTNQLVNVIISNITFIGRGAEKGFSEHKHLMNLNGVENIRIENCQFIGFQGDGILLGSSNTWGTERHNDNIKILNCLFDGINNDTRQGISIIDGSNVVVQNCLFNNTTRPDMPGAIDIEPDPVNYFARIKNITITSNTFTNVGGSVGIVSVVFPPITYLNSIGSIIIEKNNFINTNRITPYAFAVYSNNFGNTDVNLTFRNNKLTGGRGFHISGASGVNIIQNTFLNAGNNGIGYTEPNTTANKILVSNNTFNKCNFLQRPTISIGYARGIIIENNRVLNNTSNVIHLIQGTTSSTLFIRGNKLTAGNGVPIISIGKEHKTNAASNIFEGNTITGSIDRSFYKAGAAKE